MKNSIDIFKENHVTLQQSVYLCDNSNDIKIKSKDLTNKLLNFPLPMANELTIHDEDLSNSQFYVIKRCKNYIEKIRILENHEFEQQLKNLNILIKKAKNKNDYHEIINLRRQKKILIKKYNDIKIDLEYKAYSEFFKDIYYPQKPKSLIYKNNLALSSFKNISQMVPPLKQVSANFLNDVPWFVNGLNKLQYALAHQEKIGVEGGPCLFLNDEFYVILKHVNGSIKKFDYVDFKERCLENSQIKKGSVSLLEYMRLNGPNIKSVDIDCNKYDIVMREYDFFQYLFEISRALNAKLVITIPDMSYRKTFYNIFNTLPENIFSLTKKKFFQKFDLLSNANLNWINTLKKQYKDVDTTVFRYSETSLCKKFYKERESIHLNSSDINHITKHREMLDAIKDYIFMPALPYYLFGIKNIVEVNRFEEWRTVNKCKRFNKNINFTCLFPLRLSKGIENIIYSKKERFM